MNARYWDAIRPIRNQLRRFSFQSVLQALSAYLQVEVPDTDERVRRLPWIAERLVLVVLRDKPSMYGRERMTEKDLRVCLDRAWRSADTNFSMRHMRYPMELVVRQLMLAQLPHQERVSMGAFGRQIDLLRRLGPGDRLRAYLESTFGIPLDDFLQLAAIFWLKAPGTIPELLSRRYWQTLGQTYSPATADRFSQRLMPEWQSVRGLVGEADADEWFQPWILYRLPFVRRDGSVFYFGSTSLRRNLEYAFSDAVSEAADVGVRQPFDDHFEAYIGESLARCVGETLNEKETRARFSVEGQCCDFAKIDGDDVVLFEVKNKTLAYDIPASASVRGYRSKFKATVVKAEKQLSNVARAVARTPGYERVRIYRVVVTSGDLMFGNADYLFDDADESSTKIVMLGIDQLDRLVEKASRLGHCTIASFLAELEARNSKPETALFFPQLLLFEHPYSLGASPVHLQALFHGLEEDLAARLNGAEEAQTKTNAVLRAI
ncbi:hypothetical protein [Paraburkholderia sp. RL17-337-BIB-A]|uniref:hypothetical protein n=1 Tax=Paraburkholderia sp. RL17-337-BIB-A TaxID=3031636 RepID=UPI0038B7949D